MRDVVERFAKWFYRNFQIYQKEKLAVYGIGVNARRVLSCEGFTFTAVAAKDHFGESFCGREIVPLDTALKRSDRLIIAATWQATKAIFARIGPHIPAGYPVMDLYGHTLSEQADAADTYWKKTLAGLKREIDAHEVISFDIFDTLLMRKTLFPRDVFELEEQELRTQGEEVPFASWRPAAETDQFAEGHLPNFDEIYRYLQEQHHIPGKTVQRWKQREWELEMELLIPRADMVEAFRYAKAQGKTVCLTSDMYFSRLDMGRLLAAKGITGYDALFVSCDYQKSKGNGLFHPVLELAAGKSVLHVGDNEEADDFAPYSLGIDTYHIRKASDLLATSSCVQALKSVQTLADRLMLGEILARWFQSPFVLASTKGRVVLESSEKLAWLCFLPLTIRYLQFIVQTAKAAPNGILLFLSRDGYFLQKVYETLRPKFHLPPSVYFYASRQAAYGVMVREEEDIRFLLRYIRSLEKQNLRHQLEYCFQMPFSEEFDKTVADALEEWGEEGFDARVMVYKKQILAQEAKRRESYLRYMESLHLKRFQRILCVDLVTKGTVPFALYRILERPIELLAIGATAPEQKFLPPKEKSHLLMGLVPPYSPLNAWFSVMETLYASKEGQLEAFSVDGHPLFVEHSEYDPALLDRMQGALADGLEANPFIIQGEFPLSNAFCNDMLDLLDTSCTDIPDVVYDEFTFYDPADSKKAGIYNILRFMRQGVKG